ncbi:hypothetical protein [Sphingobium subterraneum]|uniref:Protocatechuate 3,4-dioxygenase beta subunit n=1 Tax=Sphingobium subterraneum TaxID=627688 RepID=A0A841J5D3_9SPHN|nr:hypothetical protein [Sphingobium subterraneum]MBB6123431.1 protocatechuate 3,4-dioxygenase beta subunit [Sphingobium subterraneum]
METENYTCEDTVGPYYAPAFLDDDRQNLTNFYDYLVRPKGDVIIVQGAILDRDGNPVKPVLVEAWQADANGRRRTSATLEDADLDPWFDGYSRHYCDDGTFELTTIMPGAVPPCRESPSARAPYITLNLYMDGTERLATQIFFEGRPENESDPLLLSLPEPLRPRLLARRMPDNSDGVPVYRIDLKLRCADETPFFEDRFG